MCPVILVTLQESTKRDNFSIASKTIRLTISLLQKHKEEVLKKISTQTTFQKLTKSLNMKFLFCFFILLLGRFLGWAENFPVTPCRGLFRQHQHRTKLSSKCNLSWQTIGSEIISIAIEQMLFPDDCLGYTSDSGYILFMHMCNSEYAFNGMHIIKGVFAETEQHTQRLCVSSPELVIAITAWRRMVTICN